MPRLAGWERMGFETSQTRRDWLKTGGGFIAGLAGALAIGGSWAYSDAKPHLSILGCGKSLALFLASGSARLLVVSEGSSTGFANAFSKSRRPGLRRIDALLIDSGNESVTLASRAESLVDARLTISIGSDRPLLDQGLSIDAALDSVRMFRLPGSLEFEIDPGTSDASSGDPAINWSIWIRRGQSSIVVAKNVESLLSQHRMSSSSSLVLVSGSITAEILEYLRPQSVIVSSQAMSGEDLRSTIDESGMNMLGYRVFQNEVLRAAFRSDGLQLPGSHVHSA